MWPIQIGTFLDPYLIKSPDGKLLENVDFGLKTITQILSYRSCKAGTLNLFKLAILEAFKDEKSCSYKYIN